MTIVTDASWQRPYTGAMKLNDDEETALYLATVEPARVWALLDTFSPERFARTLGARQGLPQPRPLEHPESFEWKERGLRRDSRRLLLPGGEVGAAQLPLMPPLAKLGYLLCLLPGRRWSGVLAAFEPELARRIQARMDQRWRLSPQARLLLIQQASFQPELFEKFARRAPQAVAEWLVDRLFFGVVAVGRLTELSPVQGSTVRLGKGPGLRSATTIAPRPGVPEERCDHLAIVMMSLPPEASAQLFKEFDPEMVHRITLAISRLPRITAEEQQAALDRVLEVTLDELEELARLQPAALALRLREYLEEGPA